MNSISPVRVSGSSTKSSSRTSRAFRCPSRRVVRAAHLRSRRPQGHRAGSLVVSRLSLKDEPNMGTGMPNMGTRRKKAAPGQAPGRSVAAGATGVRERGSRMHFFHHSAAGAAIALWAARTELLCKRIEFAPAIGLGARFSENSQSGLPAVREPLPGLPLSRTYIGSSRRERPRA